MTNAPKFQNPLSNAMPSWAKDVTHEHILSGMGIFQGTGHGHRRACESVVTFINRAREICPTSERTHALMDALKIERDVGLVWMGLLELVDIHEQSQATVGTPDWMIPIDVFGRKARASAKKKAKTIENPAPRVYQRDLSKSAGRKNLKPKI